MNNTTALLSKADQSVAIIRAYFFSQLTYMVPCQVNILFCTISILTLWRSKFFTGRLFVLLRLFILNDLTLSLFTSSLQLWHIFNGIFGVPELYSRFVCLLLNGWQFPLVTNNALLASMVALDRLQFSLQPTKKVVGKIRTSKNVGTLAW